VKGDCVSNFIFDDTPSHVFELRIAHRGSQGDVSKATTSDLEIISDRAGRRLEPYVYGTRTQEFMEFPMEIYCKQSKQYESWEVQAIQEWLFNRKEMHYLTILQPDMGNQSWKCFLTSPKIVRHAGRVIGWQFNVTTFPYSHTDIIEETYQVNGSAYIHLYNDSNYEGYIWPELTIQMISNGRTVSLQNYDDNNRILSITNIQLGDSLYIDNDKKIIKARTTPNVLQNFNLNWFRLPIGHSRVLAEGRFSLTVKMRFLKAVGGF